MPTTAEEQLALELINRSRTDPQAEFDELIANAGAGEGVQSNITAAINFFDVDLDLFQQQLSGYTTVPPLAWNDNLAQSAQTHTDLMILHDLQAHTTPGEVGIGQRIRDAGYDNLQTAAESIFAYAYDITYAHAAFYIDWGFGPGGIQDPAGHREAILSASYSEVGIDWTAENNSSTSVGPFLTTQHFANRFDYEAQVLGVVIDDADGDDFYDIGEGLGGITIEANGTGGTFVTTSWASGGYQMVLPDGVYTLTFSGTGIDGTVTKNVTVAGDNVKIDARSQDAVQAPPGQIIDGGTGADSLMGGEGADEIRGLQGNDMIQAGNGNDEVWGASGDDTIYGQADADTLRGGPDQDFIDGGAGNDVIRGQAHSDSLYGGEGNDNIKGGGGNDVIGGDAGVDVLTGGTRFDVIFGGDGDDRMYGNSHDDTLNGGDGSDLLNGGGDDDRLIGGAGNDDLKGGNGADVFVFDVGHDADSVRDFTLGEDTLELSLALAGGQTAAQIAQSAENVSNGVLLDFGGGDTITLLSVTDLTALEDAISIV